MPDTYVLFLLLQLLNFLWLVGLTAATWLRKPGLDATAAAKKIEADFGVTVRLHREESERLMHAHALRLQAVELSLKHIPSREELAELEATMREVAERQNGLGLEMKHVHSAVTRIEQHLLDAARSGKVAG